MREVIPCNRNNGSSHNLRSTSSTHSPAVITTTTKRRVLHIPGRQSPLYDHDDEDPRYSKSSYLNGSGSISKSSSSSVGPGPTIGVGIGVDKDRTRTDNCTSPFRRRILTIDVRDGASVSTVTSSGSSTGGGDLYHPVQQQYQLHQSSAVRGRSLSVMPRRSAFDETTIDPTSATKTTMRPPLVHQRSSSLTTKISRNMLEQKQRTISPTSKMLGGGGGFVGTKTAGAATIMKEESTYRSSSSPKGSMATSTTSKEVTIVTATGTTKVVTTMSRRTLTEVATPETSTENATRRKVDYLPTSVPSSQYKINRWRSFAMCNSPEFRNQLALDNGLDLSLVDDTKDTLSGNTLRKVKKDLPHTSTTAIPTTSGKKFGGQYSGRSTNTSENNQSTALVVASKPAPSNGIVPGQYHINNGLPTTEDDVIANIRLQYGRSLVLRKKSTKKEDEDYEMKQSQQNGTSTNPNGTLVKSFPPSGTDLDTSKASPATKGVGYKSITALNINARQQQLKKPVPNPVVVTSPAPSDVKDISKFASPPPRNPFSKTKPSSTEVITTASNSSNNNSVSSNSTTAAVGVKYSLPKRRSMEEMRSSSPLHRKQMLHQQDQGEAESKSCFKSPLQARKPVGSASIIQSGDCNKVPSNVIGETKAGTSHGSSSKPVFERTDSLKTIEQARQFVRSSKLRRRQSSNAVNVGNEKVDLATSAAFGNSTPSIPRPSSQSSSAAPPIAASTTTTVRTSTPISNRRRTGGSSSISSPKSMEVVQQARNFWDQNEQPMNTVDATSGEGASTASSVAKEELPLRSIEQNIYQISSMEPKEKIGSIKLKTPLSTYEQGSMDWQTLRRCRASPRRLRAIDVSNTTNSNNSNTDEGPSENCNNRDGEVRLSNRRHERIIPSSHRSATAEKLVEETKVSGLVQAFERGQRDLERSGTSVHQSPAIRSPVETHEEGRKILSDKSTENSQMHRLDLSSPPRPPSHSYSALRSCTPTYKVNPCDIDTVDANQIDEKNTHVKRMMPLSSSQQAAFVAQQASLYRKSVIHHHTKLRLQQQQLQKAEHSEANEQDAGRTGDHTFLKNEDGFPDDNTKENADYYDDDATNLTSSRSILSFGIFASWKNRILGGGGGSNLSPRYSRGSKTNEIKPWKSNAKKSRKSDECRDMIVEVRSPKKSTIKKLLFGGGKG